MDRLDGRVQRLKTLSDKTNLPERISKAITSLYARAKEFFTVRKKDEAQRTFSTAEREAKAERQKARYGRTYRASLRERMTEMRENIQILETKQKQYNKYDAFVQLIERRVETIRSEIKPPALPARMEWKATASPEAIQIKTVAEAKQAREKIPLEYRPTIKQETLVKPFKRALANIVSAAAINNSTKPTATIVKSEASKRPEKTYTLAAMMPKDSTDRTVWHKEVKLQIKSLDQVRSERTPILIKEPIDSPKVWKVEANERGRTILDRMQADIRERKATEPSRNKEGFSGRFNNPIRMATENEVIQKVRAEAITARAKVPSDMRAKPYSTGDITKGGFGRVWEKATKATKSKERSRVTMGSSFNSATNYAQKPKYHTERPSPKV